MLVCLAVKVDLIMKRKSSGDTYLVTFSMQRQPFRSKGRSVEVFNLSHRKGGVLFAPKYEDPNSRYRAEGLTPFFALCGFFAPSTSFLHDSSVFAPSITFSYLTKSIAPPGEHWHNEYKYDARGARISRRLNQIQYAVTIESEDSTIETKPSLI